MILGIDLALRHTGIAILNQQCELVTIDVLTTYDLGNFQIFDFYEKAFLQLFKTYPIHIINLEGLSFGALSNRKDMIAGLFWFIQILIHKHYQGNIELNIIPTLKWRNKLFTKEEKQQQRQAKKLLKNSSDNNITELKLLSDIKYQTYLKLPPHIQQIIQSKTTNKTLIYDMSDAYFIASYSCQ